jgi:hypothetical protein
MGGFRFNYERYLKKLRKNRNIITNSEANITAFFKFLYINKFSISAILKANKLSNFKKSLK